MTCGTEAGQSSQGDVIRIAIGSEPMQRVPCEVLKHSILSRTNRPVEIIESWTQDGGWHPVMKAMRTLQKECPTLSRGTGFALWRWCLPSLFETGKAIYLDADQIVLTDIADLWDSLPAEKTMACVCNAVGVFGKKTPEPNKAQTSVMVVDVWRLKHWMIQENPINRVAHGSSRIGVGSHVKTLGPLVYANLMQATWIPLDEIHELDPAWNHFGVIYPNTKLCHFSHVADQPWANREHRFAESWYAALRDAVEAGAVTTQVVAEESGKKRANGSPVLDRWYLKKLQRDAA